MMKEIKIVGGIKGKIHAAAPGKPENVTFRFTIDVKGLRLYTRCAMTLDEFASINSEDIHSALIDGMNDLCGELNKRMSEGMKQALNEAAAEDGSGEGESRISIRIRNPKEKMRTVIPEDAEDE